MGLGVPRFPPRTPPSWSQVLGSSGVRAACRATPGAQLGVAVAGGGSGLCPAPCRPVGAGRTDRVGEGLHKDRTGVGQWVVSCGTWPREGQAPALWGAPSSAPAIPPPCCGLLSDRLTSLNGSPCEGTPHASHVKPQQLVPARGGHGNNCDSWLGGRGRAGVAHPLGGGPVGFRMSGLSSQVHPGGPWALPTLPFLTWVLCDLRLLFPLKSRW